MAREEGSADEQDLDEARKHLLVALSAHGRTPQSSVSTPAGCGSADTNGSASSARAAFNSRRSAPPAPSVAPLTDSELSFLSSLLKDTNVPPKYIRRASRRLSDANLFPPPINAGAAATDLQGDGAGAEDGRRGKLPSALPRDHTLQDELFRNYERSGVPPSALLRRLSSRGLSSHPVRHRSSHSRPIGTGGRGSDKNALRSASIKSAPDLGLRIESESKAAEHTEAEGPSASPEKLALHDENSVDGEGEQAAVTRKGRKDVVRAASQTCQGFEVMSAQIIVAENGSSPVGKESRQTKFRLAEGKKFDLAGMEKEQHAATKGDIRTDAGVHPVPASSVDGRVQDELSSWDLSTERGSDEDEVYHHQPDAWDVLRDEYAWGYGYGEGVEVGEDGPSGAGSGERSLNMSFKILGTSADDVSCHPHVLSPPLMESLLSFMPETTSEDCNYWLKYSMVRDGPSLYRLLRSVRGSMKTVLAVETTEGHVFGSFTSMPWRAHRGYYGSHESFVWRMRRSRLAPCHSIVEQAVMESELEVYPYTGNNNNVQLCRFDRIGLGGSDDLFMGADEADYQDSGVDDSFGFALSFSSNLMRGTTSPSETFGSPCLTRADAEGVLFQVANIEVWAMTPFGTIPEAEKDEMARLFFFEEEEAAGKKLNILSIFLGSTMRD